MAGITDPVQKQAAKDATDWLILLQEEPENPDLQARFADWCAQNPVHQDAWNATQKAANLMAEVKPFDADANASGKADWQHFLAERRASEASGDQESNAPQNEAVNALINLDYDKAVAQGKVISAQTRFNKRGNMSWRGIGLGGFAVAASLLAAIIGPKIANELQADHLTSTGEISTITLADNSKVTLAPESAIKVRFDDAGRFVELLDGEAFFDVTPDPEKPFRVAADTVNVTVLGTAFDVSDGSDMSMVAVEHGLVRVENAAQVPAVFEMLEPGQQARVERDGTVTRSQIPTSQIGAWRNNQLIAQDQPLSEVVDKLRRYFSGTILITDEVLASQTVTGVYRLNDPVSALRGMARAQKATVREITPWILIVSPS